MSQVTSEQRKAAQDSVTNEAELKSLAELDTELARFVARNDSATDALLKQLGSHSDATVRKWVATHPATPVNVLLKLGLQFPEQLLQNPILDFLFLENPALLKEFPIGTVRAALKRKSAPRAILEHGLNLQDESAHLALAQNPAAPEELIDTLLQKTPHESVKEAIEARRQTEPSLAETHEIFFEALCERMAEYGEKKAESKCFEALLELPEIQADCLTRLVNARSKTVYHEDLDALVEEKNPLVLRALAERTDLSINAAYTILPKLTVSSLKNIARSKTQHPKILKVLSTSEHESVRESVARNPRTLSDSLKMLLLDASCEVRSLSACNKNIPIDAIDRSAHDVLVDKIQVMKGLIKGNYLPALILLNRNYLANNPATPLSVLTQLAIDKYEQVRVSVAENPNTPSDILAQLAKDKVKMVRVSVAENPNTPTDVLAQLEEEVFITWEAWDVRRAVAKNPNTPPDRLAQLAMDRSEWVRKSATENPNTPPDVYAQLANNKNYRVRCEVAGNPNTPADVLEQLATDKNYSVRCEVAGNPNAPADVLAQLVTDKDVYVRGNVAGNPNAPPDVLSQLSTGKGKWVRYGFAINSTTAPSVLTKLAMDKWVRGTVAGNTNAPADVLAQMVMDEDMTIRCDVAGNNNAPADVLAQLATDIYERVRRIVAKNPNTLPDVLAQLATDKDDEVRSNVAENPNTPPDVLVQLVMDEDMMVRYRAICHSNHSPKLLDDLLTGKTSIKSGMLAACLRSAHFYPTIEPYMPEVLARLKEGK